MQRFTLFNALIACLVATAATPAVAQRTPTAASIPQAAKQPQLGILHDAIVTRTSELDPRARVDIYVAVPLELLAFQNVDTRYAARISATIVVRDAASRKVYDSSATRNIVENDFSVTRGSTGKVENTVRTLHLSPGTYRVDVVINDQFAKREFTASRPLEVLDYTKVYPAVAGLLLVREIEHRGERYRISPIVGDAIPQPDKPYFVFFEAYLDVAPTEVAFSWKLTGTSGTLAASHVGAPVQCPRRTVQTFLPVIPGEPLVPNSYTLTVAMHPVKGGIADTSATLGSGTRTLVIPRSAMGDALTDVTKAIRQLRYVATQDEIDNIEAGATQGDRIARFEEFWRKLDPTPATARNEAFDEYYARVQFANSQFKSYAEGWLTDMGMVHIIYGPPTNVDRYQMQNGMSVRVIWSYAGGLSMTFDDNTGFGDYRLRTPIPAGARFTYRR